MSRLRLVSIIFLACVLGFGAGYLAARGLRGKVQPRSCPDPAGADPAGADPAGTEPGLSVGQEPGTGPARPGARGRAQASAATGQELLRGLRERNLALVRENHALRTKLEEELKERAFREGTPVPWPAEVPARFGKEALTAAVNEAIRQAGWKGEVSDVDCKEFPCVLAGHLEGSLDSGKFKRLLGQRSLVPYAGDHAQTSVSASTLLDTLGRPVTRTQFGIAFGPGAPPGTEPEVQRTIVRLRQILDSTRER